jgi:hypothetical protein
MDLLTSDWAPHIERMVRTLAAIIVAIYVAGLITGSFVHWLNDCIAGKQEWAVPAVVVSPARTKPQGFKR